MGGLNLGTWAVAGFFAISGYLITMSRDRSRSFGSFLWKRFLRIYPAFVAALFVVGFGIAPLSTLLSGEPFSTSSAVTYVLKNLSLIIMQGDIAGTLQTTPIPFAWNGSLWTLKWEFLCYIAIGFIVTVIPNRGQGAAVIVGFVLCTLGTAVQSFSNLTFGYNAGQILELGAFTAGSLLYFYGHRVSLSPYVALVVVGALVAVILTNTAVALAGLPVAYLVFWIALKIPLSTLSSTNDISYGMYIYAFPVQQVLALAFPDGELSVTAFIGLTVAFTLPLAYASWTLVERPSMRLRRIWSRNGAKRVEPAKRESGGRF